MSHVLNGKGNVSSGKISRVLKAAKILGYVVNESARSLRKGQANSLAAILPNLSDKPFLAFYNSFNNRAQEHGYQVFVYTTGDDASRELELIQKAKAEMVQGVATYSCYLHQKNPYEEAGFSTGTVLYVERRPQRLCHSIGFDLTLSGEELAAKVVEDGHEKIVLLTGGKEFSNEQELSQAFTAATLRAGCQVQRICTDARQSTQSIAAMFADISPPQAVVVTHYGMAQAVKEIRSSFFPHLPCKIYTLSPIVTLPESDFIKYELNYAQMGFEAANLLASPPVLSPQHHQLASYGFRNWAVPPKPKGRKQLSMLMLESPETFAVECVARRYTQETGTDIKMDVVDYNTMFEMLSAPSGRLTQDILRIDVTLLSWFAQEVLTPLSQINPKAERRLQEYLPGIAARYSLVDGQLFALPTSPSIQLLFYRKDLFEDVALRRLYHEIYGSELQVPANFEQFNQLASFFTQSVNPASPVPFGCTLAMGNSGVIGSEFLVRFFSYNQNLYGKDGVVRLNSDAGQRALQDICMVLNRKTASVCGWWTEACSEFSSGQTAMTILYSNFASDLLAQGSLVTNSLGTAPVPGNVPLVGGGSLGISKYSRHPEEALAFIEWICSEPASSAVALLGGTSGCEKTYENFEVVGAYPWLSLARQGFSPLKGLRQPPHNQKPFNERKLLNIIATAIRKVCEGKFSQPQALEYMQQEYEQHDA